jgi:hypothetical protein
MVQGPSCGSKRPRASLQDHGRGPLLAVFYPSRNQQDVSRFEEKILVDENEARDSEVCVQMWHLSKSQGWSFKTRWKPTTLKHSRVKMGKHIYGLHCGFAPNLAWVQLDMGHCGSPGEVCLLYTHIHHLQGQTVCRVIYVTHHPLSWHTEDYYFWQGIYLYCLLLGATTWMFGHPSYLKLSLSSSNWWTDRMSQSNHWRYTLCLCSDGWSEMGQAPSTSWVLI